MIPLNLLILRLAPPVVCRIRLHHRRPSLFSIRRLNKDPVASTSDIAWEHRIYAC